MTQRQSRFNFGGIGTGRIDNALQSTTTLARLSQCSRLSPACAGHRAYNRLMSGSQPYVIWGFEPHFFDGVERSAKTLFNVLDSQLAPAVFLVGVPVTAGADLPAACIWPADCGHSPAAFSTVMAQARQLSKADRRLYLTMNDYTARRVADDLWRSYLAHALRNTLARSASATRVASYCSVPQPVGAFFVSVILELDRAAVAARHALACNRSSRSGLTCPRSLIDGTAMYFLEECEKALRQRDPGGHNDELLPDAADIIRAAGKSLTNAAVFAGGDELGLNLLFDALNRIALERYEGAVVGGRLVFVRADHPQVRKQLEFARPVSLHRSGAVRKLLETCSGAHALLTSGTQVYALGNLISAGGVADADTVTVEFVGHYQWRLLQTGQVLMEVKYGQPRFPPERVNRAEFTRLFARVFGDARSRNASRIWALVESAAAQRHGTTLVICRDAEGEAARLGDQSTPIQPVRMTPDLMHLVSRIDGAVMIDPGGTCFAIGVILDGAATKKGDPGRGARYNSAVRYVESDPASRLAVVVSTDGAVNLLPSLRPQIDRQVVDSLLCDLRAMAALDPSRIDERKYHRVIDEINKYTFYLSAEQCAEANALLAKVSDLFGRKTGSYPLHFPLEPDEGMNESYFVSAKRRRRGGRR